MNRRRTIKILTLFILISLIFVMLTQTVFANSAEPPGLTIIVSSSTDDLSLSIRFADGSVTNAVLLQREQKAWESYYRFFYGMLESTRPSLNGATLVVQSSEYNFECKLPESSLKQYNNLLTLNIENQTISEGQSPSRLFSLFSMRVFLTLYIEGLIFFAFGYRRIINWLKFVVVNLITQGFLNVLISGPILTSYWIFGYFFFEILIFIIEISVFTAILKEHTKNRTAIYALTSNFVSLVLGGILISYLPV